jgi:hypothetical protein
MGDEEEKGKYLMPRFLIWVSMVNYGVTDAIEVK